MGKNDVREQEYAVYKGDEFVVLGTAEFCAKYLGVQANSVKFYATPTNWSRCASVKKDGSDRLVAIKLFDTVTGCFVDGDTECDL